MSDSHSLDLTVRAAIFASFITSVLLVTGKRIPNDSFLKFVPGFQTLHANFGNTGTLPEKSVFVTRILVLLTAFTLPLCLVASYLAALGVTNPISAIAISFAATLAILLLEFLTTGAPIPQDPKLAGLPGYDWFQAKYGITAGTTGVATKSVDRCRQLLGGIVGAIVLCLLAIWNAFEFEFAIGFMVFVTVAIAAACIYLLLKGGPLPADSLLENWCPTYPWVRSKTLASTRPARSVGTARWLVATVMAAIVTLVLIAVFQSLALLVLVLVIGAAAVFIYVRNRRSLIRTTWFALVRRFTVPPAATP